jgi:hypothetical protein
MPRRRLCHAGKLRSSSMALGTRDRRASALLSAALGALMVAACSTGGGATPDASSNAGDTNAPACQTGGFAVDTYAPNMQKVGTEADASARLRFVLASADPAPPSDGVGSAATNTWTIRVLDATGQPVKDAVVSLPWNASPWGNPWMAVHKHPSTILPTVTNNGDGTATLVMNFFMPGLWRVFIHAQSASTADGSLFAFCTP